MESGNSSGGDFSSKATHGENLETFTLLWLNASIDVGQEYNEQLRSIINYLKRFDNVNECEQYIRSMNKDDRIVLIISDNFGEEILPNIHSLRQISSIYIQSTNNEWTNKFHKIKSVNDNLDELIVQIKTDQIRRRKIEEPISIDTFDAGHTIDRSSISNDHFIHMHFLIDCFLQIKSPDSNEHSNNRHELIELCKNEYQNNTNQLKILHEFEYNYSSSNALWWYTLDSFLYRLLNKALYTFNIDLLYQFRFFIRDIYRQLQQYQCSSSVHVYRGQLMSNDELQNLKNSVGKYISINSFLSASINRDVALTHLIGHEFNEDSVENLDSDDDPDDLKRILFRIDADPRVVKSKPFANITVHSHATNDEEILFSLGSIFRLENIHRNKNGLWIVYMILCGENDPPLKTIFDPMKNSYGESETNLLALGNILRRMGKLNEAEKCYHRLLKELPLDDEQVARCYHNLGRVAEAKEDYETSLQWLRQSLKIKMRILKMNDPSLAHSHNYIGIVYQQKGDREQALDSFNKALHIWRQAYGKDHPKVAGCLNNMGVVYKREKKYTEALDCFQKALSSRQKHLPPYHLDLAGSHNNIGAVYVRLGHDDLALEHYNMSLKIKSKSLPPQHPSIASTLENMGYVYENKGAFLQALSYFEKAATIYRSSLPSNHHDVIQIEENIRRVSLKI